MEVENIKRTKYQAKLDVEYEVRLHALHFRLFDRLRKLTSFITILAAMAVVAPLRADSTPFNLGLGLLVAALGAANFVWDFGGIARTHDAQRRAYQNLLGQLGADVASADAARAAIAKDDPADIEILRKLAYNDVLRSFGHDGIIQAETRLERLLRAIA